MKLVIVESPAKAKTIEKYLGTDFKVLASFGHVRDLPQKELGIDVDHDFAPKYVDIAKAKKVISDLKRYQSKSDMVYLATDLDREGEAISWHLLNALGIKENDSRVKRIVFSEITKNALESAVKNPRGLDMDLVNAQQGRRILDRLVGYKLSPLLWKKVKSGLSAGRVQSVAVRLIVDREKEINNFKPKEFWVLGVTLSKKDKKPHFKALLRSIDGKDVKKFDIKDQNEAQNIISGLPEAEYQVLKLAQREQIKKPSVPFTTSTLQMEASRKFGYSAKQTMRLAQTLYESGHISYMRTDSLNLSKEALLAIREVIDSEYGKEYLPEKSISYTTKAKRAQEAHEAIRPTHFDRKIVSSDPKEQKLYDIIWKRTVASQMNNAIFNIVTAEISAKTDKDLIFTSSGEVMKFDGFIRVYTEGVDDDVDDDGFGKLPALKEGEILDYINTISEQKFTEPPKRYTEATLVKKMESLSIGRPSTYAPTIATIQDRGYVELTDKRFVPTEIGTIVTDLLIDHFQNVVDYQFTAHMEDELDNIALGKTTWVKVIREFYEPFIANILSKSGELDKTDIVKPEPLEEKCPKCGEFLQIKLGRFGKFISCSKYPECKYTRPLDSKTDESDLKLESEAEKCEKCGGKMLLKEGRFGKFLACEKYPECKNTRAIIKSIGLKCPDCGKGDIIEKRTKRGKIFWGCSDYPNCKFASWDKPKNAEEKIEQPNEEIK